MALKKLLLSNVLLLAVVLLETRDVEAYCSDSNNDDDPNKLETFVHGELPFAQGLSLRDLAGGMQTGVDDVVQAWYMDDDGAEDEDQRLPHHCRPDEIVPLAKLLDLGIVALWLDADNHDHDENLKIMREQRGYSHMVSQHYSVFQVKL